MQLRTISWNDQYKKDMEAGIAIDITVVNGVNKDGVRHPNGIYSPFFGSTSSDTAEFVERYSCDCKDLKGKFNFGLECPLCGTKVIYRKTDVSRVGYINIDEDYCVIQPLMYKYIKKVIGKYFDPILKYEREIDIDGVEKEIDRSKQPFCSIGMLEFRDRFEEILAYYYEENKSKNGVKAAYDFLLKNKDKIFVNHIPVFSLVLRDITIIKDNVMSEPINKKYSLLVGTVKSLNKKKNKIDTDPLKILPMMHNIQDILLEIDDIIFNMVGGKDGHIRSNILGNRVNFSSRCVIVPLIGKYKIDEVVLPYSVVMSFYKFEIINMISRMDNCSLSKALDKWNKGAEKFDRRMYLIMKHLIDNTPGGLRVLINR